MERMAGAQPEGKSKATLTARGEKSQPPPGQEDLAPATCRAPPPARRLPSQPGMQPGGWNGTEGASTPPLSPRFPNDRGGKFTSRGGVAFRWVSLTPLRRRPSLGSPSSPAQTTRRLPLHLKTRKPGLGHLRRRVPLGIGPPPSRRPAAAGGCRRPTHLWWRERPAVRPTGPSGSRERGAFRQRPETRSPDSAACRLRGRASPPARGAGVDECVFVRVCARESVCECVRACVGRGGARSQIPLGVHPALCRRLLLLLALRIAQGPGFRISCLFNERKEQKAGGEGAVCV